MIEVEYELGRPVAMGQQSNSARGQFLNNVSLNLSTTDVAFRSIGTEFVVTLPLTTTDWNSTAETTLTTALQDNFSPTVTHTETRDV